MTKKEREFKPIASDWLKGKEGVSEYLGGVDIRTIEEHLKGLTPDAHLGRVMYYHKKTIDRLMFKTMKV